MDTVRQDDLLDQVGFGGGYLYKLRDLHKKDLLVYWARATEVSMAP